MVVVGLIPLLYPLPGAHRPATHIVGYAAIQATLTALTPGLRTGLNESAGIGRRTLSGYGRNGF